MVPLDSLARVPFEVEGVEWISRVVRTGGISGPLHDEWALSVRFMCEEPFRAAAFMDADETRLYSRDWARHSEPVAELGVHFAPYDWDNNDEVQVMAGGIRVAFESAPLKTDPVATTHVDVTPGLSGYTGEPLTILRIPEVGAALGVLLVRSTDTKGDRTRWRLRDEHVDGLGDFSFLATGRRSGWASLSL
jgi:hypothetical protein